MLKAEQIISRLKGLRGFTIAEILIAMVVLGLLGALTVPMLGKQKDKPWLKTKRVHGTVECYYYAEEGSSEYKLYMFLSDNQGDGNGHEILEGGSDDNGNSNNGTACYFKMPNANSVIIQAVGAGGDGGHGDMNPGYEDDTVLVRGAIPVDNTFHAAMTAETTPKWVIKEWDRQWDDGRPKLTGSSRTVEWIKYEVTSALGGGGNDICRPKLIYFESGSPMIETCKGCTVGTSFTDTDLCPSGCTDILGANGGNGAKGGIVDVQTRLNYSSSEGGRRDNVVYNLPSTASDSGTPQFGVVELKFNSDKYVRLQPSARGVNAYLRDNSENSAAVGRTEETASEFDGKIWNKNEKYTYKGSVIGSDNNLKYAGVNVSNIRNTADFQPGRTMCGKNGAVAERYKPGKIVVSEATSSIPYQTDDLAIKGYFGLAGEPGTTTKLYYENIPMGSEIRLTPAKNSSQRSVIEMKKGEEWVEISIAVSGENGKFTASGEKVQMTDEGDFPFPRKYYPEGFKGKSSDLSVSGGAGYTSKLADLLRTNNFNPGASGNGAYPVVKSVSGDATHYINNVKTGNEHMDKLEYEGYSVYRCLDGSEPLSGAYKPEGGKYCGGTYDSEDIFNPMRGKPGAVVISW